jgi:DNA-binding beta-propeller fold protein YncE
MGTNSAAVAHQHRSFTPPTKSFAIAKEPRGIAFDGANIWVVNQGYNLKVDGSVTKLNSANGATLGIFPVGHHPSTAAFDGANIWVDNTHDNTVNKLRAKDGA